MAKITQSRVFKNGVLEMHLENFDGDKEVKVRLRNPNTADTVMYLTIPHLKELRKYLNYLLDDA